MHDVLRERLLRKIESLPEEQIYQVLDYIEFLESKYSGDLTEETTGLQRFAERLEDRMRRKAVSPNTLREAFQLISAADRVLSSVSSAGRDILDGLNESLEPRPEPPAARGREVGETGEERRGDSPESAPGTGSEDGPARG